MFIISRKSEQKNGLENLTTQFLRMANEQLIECVESMAEEEVITSIECKIEPSQENEVTLTTLIGYRWESKYK